MGWNPGYLLKSFSFYNGFYLFVSSSFIRLNVYCPNLTSLVAGRQPSYLSAGISTRWASKLLKQSLVTMISAPFLSMSLTHLSSAREQDFPQYLKLDNNFVAIIVQICREKSFSNCELLFSPVLESRNIVLRKGCASSRPQAKNL